MTIIIIDVCLCVSYTIQGVIIIFILFFELLSVLCDERTEIGVCVCVCVWDDIKANIQVMHNDDV